MKTKNKKTLNKLEFKKIKITTIENLNSIKGG